jgi:hypothetical protein
MGEVRQGLVLDLSVFAIGPAQKGCRIDLLSHHSFRCDHMTGSASARHEVKISQLQMYVNKISDYIFVIIVTNMSLQIQNKDL